MKLVLTRQQMFTLVGYRTPTLQRVRLGADAQGRITAVSHEAVEQTSRIKEFAEQTTVGTRSMYAGDARRTTHRLVPLDVAVPSWMRAPGEAPGMFGLESAMDELAEAVGLDPVELRVRNEPEPDPETGLPWSSRHLVECLHAGAARFGWDLRGAPGARREGDWLVGLGMASSTYPAYLMPGNTASVAYGGHGHYSVRIGAADIGTGSWTALTQIAADALGMPFDHVHLEIGDTMLPKATVEGGSAGLASHGSAILLAGRRFRGRARHGAGGGGHHRGDHRAARRAGVRPALLRRAVRGGPGERRHRGGAGAPDGRGVLLRPDRQPAHRPLAAHRRDGVGALDGPAREVGRRPRARPRRHPRPRGLPRPVARRHRRHRRDLARRGGPARQPARAPRASARSASPAPPPRWRTRCYNATGTRVRDLPITPDRLLR